MERKIRYGSFAQLDSSRNLFTEKLSFQSFFVFIFLNPLSCILQNLVQIFSIFNYPGKFVQMGSSPLLSNFLELTIFFNIVFMYLVGENGWWTFQSLIICGLIFFLMDWGELIWKMVRYGELLNVHVNFIYVKYIKSNNYFINCFLGSSFLST